MKQALLILALITLSACQATNVEKITQTPSGFPDATFNNSKSATQSKLVNLCLDKGYLVTQNPNSVVCQGSLADDEEILANVFLKPNYATATEVIIDFQTFNLSSNNTRVHAKQWIQWQTAFGQTQKTMLNSPHQFNSIQEQLYLIGGH